MANTKIRIRSGDTVKVIAGRNKGTLGKVLRILPDEGRALVEGVHLVTRHQKAMGEQQGAKVQKEAPIHISNLALWVGEGEEGRVVKVAFRTLEDGKKVRVDRKTGDLIDA